jgi:hypothetical protein
MALDDRQKMTLWIPTTDIEIGIRVRTLLIEFVQNNGSTGQPNWDFLMETKAPKNSKVAA